MSLALPSGPRMPASLQLRAQRAHLSVNPLYGCLIGCPFCLSLADATPLSCRRITRLAPEEPLVEALLLHRSLIQNLSLSLLDTSDPFAPFALPSLRRLITLLAERLPGQAVTLTTRLHPGTPVLRWLAEQRALRLTLFVSLGDATGRTPPVTPVNQRLRLLKQASALGLHAVMLLRPLVREWCTPQGLQTLLRQAPQSCSEIVLAPLILAPAIERSLRAARWPVPQQCDDAFLREVAAEAVASAGSVPVSSRRSCAINRRWKRACRVSASEARLSDVLPVRACLGRCGPDLRPTTETFSRPVACRCAADAFPAPRIVDCEADISVVTDSAGYCRYGKAA